jgi:hypothetical protein
MNIAPFTMASATSRQCYLLGGAPVLPAATERGIYHVSYLRDGRRMDMEPLIIMGTD